MVNNFLQNHFTVGDDDSTSDGDSVTISVDVDPVNDGDNNVEEDVTNTNEPAAEPPAAATKTPVRSQRPRIPRNFFQAGTL
jgi:hypothetical protein